MAYSARPNTYISDSDNCPIPKTSLLLLRSFTGWRTAYSAYNRNGFVGRIRQLRHHRRCLLDIACLRLIKHWAIISEPYRICEALQPVAVERGCARCCGKDRRSRINPFSRARVAMSAVRRYAFGFAGRHFEQLNSDRGAQSIRTSPISRCVFRYLHQAIAQRLPTYSPLQ